MTLIRSGVLHQLLACAVVSLAVLVVGTALGWPSPVILAVQTTGKPFNMTHDEIAVMVSAVYLGNMLSPIPSGYFMDTFGRKNTLHCMTVIPIISWFLVYIAKSALFLQFSRFLMGLWLGAVSTIVPMYIAEVSEPNVRGAFSTFVLLMTNLGLLFVYLTGSLMDYYELTYVLGAIPILLAIVLYFIPESPYWYVKRARYEDAFTALSWLRCRSPDLVKEELEIIETSMTEQQRRAGSYKDLLSTRGNRKALLTVELLSFAQRASGISALFVYASTTLPSGVGHLSLNDCVTVMGVVLCISVFPSTFLVDKSGRRPLLIVSSIGCALFMFTAGIWFFLDSNTEVDVGPYSWVPFASFLAYCVFISLGLGPLATTVQGEMFPTNVKGLASGITAIVLALTSFLMNMVYHRVADAWGMHANYWLFAAASLLAAVYTVTSVVETKGKTLQEIQRELNKL